MYTYPVYNEPHPYYIYQTDLSHPKVGNIYYKVNGPNGIAVKQIDRQNKILMNGNKYKEFHNYMPSNDTKKESLNVSSAEQCQQACNKDDNCKYVYVSDKKQCLLGNKVHPHYIPRPNDSSDKYTLYLRNQVVDIEPNDGSTDNVEQLDEKYYRDFKPTHFGPTVNGPGDIGKMSTPIGKKINEKATEIKGGDVSTKATVTTPSVIPGITKPNYAFAQDVAQVGPDQTTYSSLSGFRSGPIPEGFDTHDYSYPISDDNLYPDIRDGQIIPLQEIAKDYSSRLAGIDKLYYDISGNITHYNNLYKILNNNAAYDFSGIQPIVFSGNTDLLTEMKNDSKRLALQTNNMYIAGSILTTTLLVSAIYLGRP